MAWIAAEIVADDAEQPRTPAGATWDMTTLLVLTLLAIVVGWGIVRMARLRLLPPERRQKRAGARRPSPWVEAGRRLNVEPAEPPDDEHGERERP